MANSNSNNSQILLDPALFGTPQSIQSLIGEASIASGGAPGAAVGQSSDALAQLNHELLQLQTVAQAQTDSTKDNTRAVEQNTTQRPQSGSSTLGTIGQTLQNVFGVGLGL